MSPSDSLNLVILFPGTTSFMANEKHFVRGMLCTLAGGIFWGFSGVCCQYIFEHNTVDPLWLTAWRMVLAGALLLAMCCMKDATSVKAMLVDKKTMVSMLFYCILAVAGAQFLYLTTIDHSNAGTATVLQFTGAVMVMLWVCLRRRVLPNRYELLAVIFAVAGTVLFSTQGQFDQLSISSLALIFGILSAVAGAAYSIWPVRMILKYGAFAVTGVSMFLGGAILCVYLQVWNTPYPFDFMSTLAFAGLVIVGTALAFSLYMQGVGDIGAVRASMIVSTEPLSATILSAVLLGTVFSVYDWIGFVLVIATVFLLAIPQEGGASGASTSTQAKE